MNNAFLILLSLSALFRTSIWISVWLLFLEVGLKDLQTLTPSHVFWRQDMSVQPSPVLRVLVALCSE